MQEVFATCWHQLSIDNSSRFVSPMALYQGRQMRLDVLYLNCSGEVSMRSGVHAARTSTASPARPRIKPGAERVQDDRNLGSVVHRASRGMLKRCIVNLDNE